MLIDAPDAARAQVLGEPVRKPAPMEFGDYLRILRERWFAIVVVMLFMLIGTGIFTMLVTPTYVSQSTLFVTVSSAQDNAYENSQFARQRVASYPDLVDSPKVLQKVKDELSLDMDLPELARHVKAVNPPETVLLEVSADSDEAAQAAQIANSAAKELSATIEELETSSGAGGTTVEANLMVPATASTNPDEPRALINLALALIVGLSAGIGLALILDRSEQRIRWARDIERDFGLGVVGEVESAGATVDASIDPKVRTAYRELAANLQLINDGTVPRRTLLVVVGEEPQQQHYGAAALARVLADVGSRVCLVDGDAAAVPALDHRLHEPGVGEILSGTAEVDEAMQRIEHLPLGYLPAGSAQVELRRHDVAGQTHSLLKSLEVDHDAVLLSTRFDALPLDASLLAPSADCVLLVCRARGTFRADLAATLNELKAARVSPAGVVLVHDAKRRARRRQRG